MKWLLFSLLIALVPSAYPAGLIVVQDSEFLPGPQPIPLPLPRVRLPHPVWAPLEVSYSKVEVVIKDQVAVTKVDEEFYNPNSRQLEGTFIFPVPRGAQLDRFAMEINGQQVEAELLAADKARGIYEEIVRKAKDPALLEYAERDLFKVRIFPIEPHAKKRIQLSYSQVLRAESGLVNYVFPLSTEKFSSRPVKNLSVKVQIQTQRPLKAIYSPSHDVEVKRSGARSAVVGFESTEVKPSADFQLFYSQEEGEFGLTLLTHKEKGDEEGYFLLLASPDAEQKTTRSVPKDIAFVLDTSGSMAGPKLEQARKALLFCIENLNDQDRFEIIRFATETEALFDGLLTANAENRQRARVFVQNLKPIGGTAIADALKKAEALRPASSGRPYTVIFLTDGRPTVGVTDENRIVQALREDPETLTRIFCFGIGTDVNTHLLDRLAEKTKAFSQYVLPEEDLELKVSSFYAKIKEPALANPQLTFPPLVHASKLYPSPLPDLFKGQQLVVAGRYKGKGAGEIRIEGSVNGEKLVVKYEGTFPEDESDHAFISRLWATRRVGYLLDEIRLQGENKEIRDEVTELARRFNIVTPFTAYLILEDERRREIPEPLRLLRTVEQDVTLRRQASDSYESLRTESSGGKAVAGARSALRLKMADVPADAIALGNSEVGRAYNLNPSGTDLSSASRLPGQSRTETKTGPAGVGSGIGGQSQFVGGRSFYQNEGQWLDTASQNFSGTKRVRIQFGSEEYFRLGHEHTETLPWLALGAQLQFVLNGTLYQVVE